MCSVQVRTCIRCTVPAWSWHDLSGRDMPRWPVNIVRERRLKSLRAREVLRSALALPWRLLRALSSSPRPWVNGARPLATEPTACYGAAAFLAPRLKPRTRFSRGRAG